MLIKLDHMEHEIRHLEVLINYRSTSLRKKVKPKQVHPGAVLENGATFEGGAFFTLIIMFQTLFLGENSSTFGSGTKIMPWMELSYIL